MEYHSSKQVLFVSRREKITQDQLRELTKTITEEELPLFEMINLYKCLLPFRLHVNDPMLVKAISYMNKAKPSALAAPVNLEELPFYDKLYPYQKAGIIYCVNNKRALLADEMGLGKTIQAMGWSYLVTKKPKVLVASAGLLQNWKKELETWLPKCKVQVIKADSDLIIADMDYILVSVGLMKDDKKKREELLSDGETYGAVIFDEAHCFQNPKSQQSKALLSCKIENILFVTGTPLLGKHIHLYCMMKMMFPDFLTQKAYEERYCDAHLNKWNQWDVSGSIRQKELFMVLKTKMIRRFVDDVSNELPPLYSHVIKMEISQADLLVYKKVLKTEELLLKKPANSLIGNKIKNIQMEKYRITSQAKSQIVPGFLAAKLKTSKKKTIIWYHFDKMKDAILARLPPEKTLHIGGDTDPSLRVLIVQHFNTSETKQFIVLSITACCTGLNITSAEEMYFADRGFTPAYELQAKKRAHRIGCKKEVNCFFLVALGTYDDNLMNVLDKKDKVVNETLQEEKKMKMDSVIEFKEFEGIEYEAYGVSAPFGRKIPPTYLPYSNELINDWIERVTKEEEFDEEKIRPYRRKEFREVNNLNMNPHGKYYNVLEMDEYPSSKMRIIYGEEEILAAFVTR